MQSHVNGNVNGHVNGVVNGNYHENGYEDSAGDESGDELENDDEDDDEDYDEDDDEYANRNFDRYVNRHANGYFDRYFSRPVNGYGTGQFIWNLNWGVHGGANRCPVPPTPWIPEYPEHINILSRLAEEVYDNPNQWVCETCVCTHEISPVLVPSENFDEHIFCSCPKTTMEFGMWAYNTSGYRVDPRLAKFDHRHVQLAMKWTRLKDIGYKPLLDLIMRPTERMVPAYIDHRYLHFNVPMVIYKATPKIILREQKLRFLLKSVWRFSRRA
ncbi:hypothetical protein F4801DRAFT_308543 [Xylaria longipes]|nr:hypothetical protein F4801DRAFT_308543 [Xylaria longipes]